MICESDVWRIFKFYNSTVPHLVKKREGVNFVNVFVIDIVSKLELSIVIQVSIA